MISIDINCDMGEGMDNDALLMPYISSANIACGYHAGSPDIIRRTMQLCIEHHVAIGAHPSFNDHENFGRTEMHLEPAALFDLVSEQLHVFKTIADEMGASIHHVKPHGALYNMAAKDAAIAEPIARAVFSFNSGVLLYGLANSCSLTQAAAKGLKTASEVFADRTYQPDGSLTPRSQPNALHASISDVIEQVSQMVLQQTVTATNGTRVPIKADTICIHGDGAHAVDFAKAIYGAMTARQITVTAV